jgi:acyl-CoA reductase-like NAD-dependent aldehyde dehydrogenase
MTTAELPSRTYPFLLGGELKSGADSVPIRSPYSGDPIGRAELAGPDDVAAALDAAVAARSAVSRLPAFSRPRRGSRSRSH